MADLVYGINLSVDGYAADAEGRFDWSVPSDELHEVFNDLIGATGTHLYGRRMYEAMSYWEAPPDGSSSVELEFGRLWRDSDKVVYSTSLAVASTARTRIERAFDAEAVRAMKAEASRDLLIGGPTLAAAAIRAGLVDEYLLVVAPVVVGGGLRALPDDVRLDLALIEERRFPDGVVLLRYRNRTTG